MAKLRIRVGTNQTGFLYSVKNLDTDALSSYIPGSTLPYINITPHMASTAARPVRFWLLDDELQIEGPNGSLMMEGNKGDYLVEGEDGSLFVIKSQSIRDEYDIEGDVSRVYRTPLGEMITFEDRVVGTTKTGTEF